MKIFITGATGFVGTHLIRKLAETNHKMYCLTRKTSRVDELRELGVTLVEGDVTDKVSLLKGMKGCEWVVNLANIYSFWEPDKNRYSEVNINGTRNVMESALETSISKIMHTSNNVYRPLSDFIQ